MFYLNFFEGTGKKVQGLPARYDESIHFGVECLHLIFAMFVYQSLSVRDGAFGY